MGTVADGAAVWSRPTSGGSGIITIKTSSDLPATTNYYCVFAQSETGNVGETHPADRTGARTLTCPLPVHPPANCALPCNSTVSVSYNPREFPSNEAYIFRGFTYLEDFIVFWVNPGIIVPSIDSQDIELRGSGFFGDGWTDSAACRIGGSTAIPNVLLKSGDMNETNRAICPTSTSLFFAPESGGASVSLEISPNGVDWIDVGLHLLLLDAPTITTITPQASVPAEKETSLYISGSGFESSLRLACVFSAERGDISTRDVFSTAYIHSDKMLSFCQLLVLPYLDSIHPC